jgi:predicted O-methyltransferase YrrM
LVPTGAGREEDLTLNAEMAVPSLVEQAYAVARQSGFALTRQEAGPDRPSACLPGVGRFLAMLAAGCQGGTIAELGTGAGIGAAWIASAMPADCMLVTAELDAGLAAAAAGLLARDARVQVLAGDARVVLAPHAPFDLIFADSGVRDAAAFAALSDMLRPGGRIVMDDLTPVLALPADSPLRQSDIKRSLLAGQDSLTWTEVVLPDLANSLLVGTRRTA